MPTSTLRRAVLPVLRAVPRSRGAAYAVSVDDPSDARPQPKQPPMSRVAPSPPQEAPTMEEPSLGKSNLLTNDEKTVRSPGLPTLGNSWLELTLTTGISYSRSEIHRRARSPRAYRKRTTDTADESVPIYPRCPRVCLQRLHLLLKPPTSPSHQTTHPPPGPTLCPHLSRQQSG